MLDVIDVCGVRRPIDDVIETEAIEIDRDVLVRDSEPGQVIVVDVASVLVLVRVAVPVLVRVLVVFEANDRAVCRVRVIVMMGREMEVGEDLDRQQPQQGCYHRECAAMLGRTMSPHLRRNNRICTSNRPVATTGSRRPGGRI